MNSLPDKHGCQEDTDEVSDGGGRGEVALEEDLQVGLLAGGVELGRRDGRVAQLVLEVLHNEKKETLLFNDALNTFYLPLYGIGHMVKDHSNSKRRNSLPPLHEVFFFD